MKKILVVLFVLLGCNLKTIESNQIVIFSDNLERDFYPDLTFVSGDESVRKAVLGSSGLASTTYLSDDGRYLINNTITKKIEKNVNDDGSRTFKIQLNEGIKFSDGSEAKALDFISWLYFVGTSEAQEALFSSDKLSKIVGGEDYQLGLTDKIEGLGVIDDYTFFVTYKADNFPYYWENALLKFYPMKTSDFFTNGDVTNEPLVKKVLENIAYPIGAGPYKIKSINESNAITLEKNQHYIGDYEGRIPKVSEYLITPSDDVETENFAKYNLVFAGKLLDLPKINKSNMDASTFESNGFEALFFHLDMPIISDIKVRQALMYLIDRETYLNSSSNSVGSLVHGIYSNEMFEVSESKIVSEKLNKYEADSKKAAELLDEAGWKYDKFGNRWENDGTSRYNKNGEELILYWNTVYNVNSDNLKEIIEESLKKAGINLVIESTDLETLLDNYYNSSELSPSVRKYHIFNFTKTFEVPNNPCNEFYHSKFKNSPNNNTSINDEHLDKLIDSITNVQPGNEEEYLKAWEEYQLYMNELVVMIPIHTNLYYNVYSKVITNVINTPFWTWGDQIHLWEKSDV